VNIEDHVTWGTNVRAIGTFLIDSQIHSYNIYVVSPSERQVIKYPTPPPTAAVTLRSVALTTSQSRRISRRSMICMSTERSTSWTRARSPGMSWASRCPSGCPRSHRSRTEKPFYTHLTADNAAQDQGTFYACDSANGRIVAFTKTAGAFVQQYMVPAGSHWFTSLTGMFRRARDRRDRHALLTESGNLMSASLQPVVVQTPSPVVPGSSVFTYRALGDESLR